MSKALDLVKLEGPLLNRSALGNTLDYSWLWKVIQRIILRFVREIHLDAWRIALLLVTFKFYI